MTNCFQYIIWINIGCVIATNYFETYFVEPKFNQNSRNALKLEQYKWPNGLVHYVFDTTCNEMDRKAVYSAMELIMEKTCTKFELKQPSHIEHIKFLKSETGACGANIGYRPNRSEPLDVTFTQDCLNTRGAIQHELLHVLGLLHEHCRPDRNEYIEILWKNIDPRFYLNFVRGEFSTIETFDLPYDYESLMHYPRNAFAVKGTNVTIVARKDPSMRLGQSIGPTFYDLEKIRRMYKC